MVGVVGPEVACPVGADHRLRYRGARRGRPFRGRLHAGGRRALAADEKVTYRYALAADVTDEGGETRSATRVFRLGFVAVEASIETDSSFFRSGAPARLTVRRTALDGVATAGAGELAARELVQPPTALTPADEPRTTAPGRPGAEAETAGDHLRARWDTGVTAEVILRLDRRGELRRGTVDHDADGEAAIDLGTPPPGAYRLIYETSDDFGATCEVTRDLVVAGRAGRLAVPLVVWSEAASVPVGDTARLLVHSGLPTSPWSSTSSAGTPDRAPAPDAGQRPSSSRSRSPPSTAAGSASA